MVAAAGSLETNAARPSVDSAREAFEFVKALASELSEGKIELPSFPDVATRVQRVLSDENVTQERVVRVVGSEPALAARVVGIANSAAINTTGRAISELRTAVARMGFDMVRTAAMSFAMAQLKRAEEFRSLERPLNLLWHRSVTVAALSYVIAKRLTKLQPDSAMLAGLLHGVGRLYILTRASKHPVLFADAAAYNGIVMDWHASIARAVLENWGMAEEIVEAVSSFEDPDREARGQISLTDILGVASVMASYKDQPETVELKLAESSSAARIAPDRTTLAALFRDSAEEMAALRSALSD